MEIAVVQFDNRSPKQLGPMQTLMGRNKSYAERHGYKYNFFKRTDIDIPPYWLKPRICERLLSSGCDIVAWIDSDATFHNLDVRIEDMFTGAEAMVAAGDNPAWSSPINAGVFFARGARGAEIMRNWSLLFDPAVWFKEGGHWMCNSEWAGTAYEQGAFVAHLAAKLIASGDLRVEDWRRLQSPFPLPESFTVHFPRMYALNIPVYVQAF